MKSVTLADRGIHSARDKAALRTAFERVAIPCLSAVYRAAFYLTKSRVEAEDLVQETYLRALGSFERFKPGSNCRAWLLSIMRNMFITAYRKGQREPEAVDWVEFEKDGRFMAAPQSGANTNKTEDIVFSKLAGDCISAHIQMLPEIFRTVIVLVDIEELRYQEAAEILKCPIGTVRSRLFRGRRMLQAALKSYRLEKKVSRKTPVASGPADSNRSRLFIVSRGRSRSPPALEINDQP